MSDKSKARVIEFYEDDETSATMPGKKDYVSVKHADGKRVHCQKRLLLSNLREMYEAFKETEPDLHIGFSSFAALRPKHCVFADDSGAHTVCVCSQHQNMKLMILGNYNYYFIEHNFTGLMQLVRIS